MCQQLMREQHRLGVLQMREAWRRHVDGLLRLLHQRGFQLYHPRHHLTRVVTQVEPKVGCDLVVAAATRT